MDDGHIEMSSSSATKPARSGLSLYANLLDESRESSSSTISGAPVTYKQAGAATDQNAAATDKQQISAGS